METTSNYISGDEKDKSGLEKGTDLGQTLGTRTTNFLYPKKLSSLLETLSCLSTRAFPLKFDTLPPEVHELLNTALQLRLSSARLRELAREILETESNDFAKYLMNARIQRSVAS